MTEENKHLCLHCKSEPPELNGFLCAKCMKLLHYNEKAGLLLQDSCSEDWGIVLFNSIPEENQEIVGYWRRCSDKLIWISLTTPIEALLDKTTILMAELSERRRRDLPLIGIAKKKRESSGTSKKSTKKVVAKVEVEKTAETLKSLQALRDKIRSSQK